MTAPSPRGGGRLAAFGAPMLGLLAIEFLLGMALALFVTLPTGNVWTVLSGSPLLWLHIVVGFLLIGIAGNALRWAIAGAPRVAQGVTALGFVSAIGAFLAGMAFAFGDQTPAASYAMSVGFVGVLIDAGYLLSLRPRLVVSAGGARPEPTPGEG